MTFETITWVWITMGLILMLGEIVVPGLVVIFLGAGAVLVGIARYFGVIQGELNSFTWWFILSLLLIFVLRSLVQRITPGDISYQTADDDIDAFGEVADVVNGISIRHDEGRIKFHGSTWPAKCGVQEIERGRKVRVISRDNIHWVVEPVDEPLD